MKAMSQQLADAQHSGVYQLLRGAEEVATAAGEAGLTVFRIDIGKSDGKKDFLAAVANALRFPEWFGGNWDALNDCLTDLEWLSTQSGYVLVFEDGSEFVMRHKSEFDNAKAVLSAAAKCWKTQGRPFWAFIEMPQSVRSGLPNWPAE